jgi:hypothetical protein
MRLILLTGVWVMMIGLVLGASSKVRGTQAIETSTSTPVDSDDLRVFPGDLVCDDIEETGTNAGPSWMGITVGQSTLADVEQLLSTLSDEYVFLDDDDYDTRFVIWTPTQVEEGEPTSIRLCLNQNIVQVIAVRYPYPLTRSRPYLIDLVNQFGEPDAITWNDNPSSRGAFWFERGLAVVVSVVPNDPDQSIQPSFGLIALEIYFPYQDVEDYETRWPYNQTRLFNQFLSWPYEGYDDYGPENPFDFDAMLATITAEPSQTPTPTFALPTIPAPATP